MNYSSVLVKKSNKIGTITLNRPNENNTFNIELATELNEALMEMEHDSEVHVVIINANGKNFCAGIDVSYVDGKSHAEYLAWSELMGRMNITIAKMGKPVIASIRNVAVANGVGLVAACDIAIASQNARFGATAINVGLFCMGPAVPMVRSLGRKKTLEMILTGDLINSDEAVRIGLINKVVEDESLEEETLKYAQKLADKSPVALQIGKKSFYKMEDLNLASALDLTDNHFATLCTTEDGQEGVKAFFDKRKPVWKN
ncbi:MAG: enoyl-CoA hydratase/isomerase family protein [Tissierellales bacterium]|nr:enoyl-CoA hydratase/isomerase family protein [Tissierellales bacterium]MBN2826513.1 enoyl-CoA hydratase/isomerase family protein [Tissierellales bacterium]